ncbi:MAG TPA: hypothetical protein VII06_30785 [Chloroflexota bacterium]
MERSETHLGWPVTPNASAPASGPGTAPAGRPYDPRKRRVTMYMSINYPLEVDADLADFNNRNIAMFELRRLLYPKYEWAAGPEYKQGIAGPMDMFLADFRDCLQFMTEVTEQQTRFLLRVNPEGELCPLDERVLGDTDTLILISSDHLKTGQQPYPAETEALQEFLGREGARLIVCPHHEVGLSDDPEVREMEHRHHGDVFVGRQERYSGFARALFTAFGLPIMNQWGLNPAKIPGTSQPAPLTVADDLDKPGLLRGITSFGAHSHFPHLAVTTDDTSSAHVLATQPINLEAPPHPWVQAGNTQFNALVWLPPSGKRAADVLVTDLTRFMAMFGDKENLQRFWRNLAQW